MNKIGLLGMGPRIDLEIGDSTQSGVSGGLTWLGT